MKLAKIEIIPSNGENDLAGNQIKDSLNIKFINDAGEYEMVSFCVDDVQLLKGTKFEFALSLEEIIASCEYVKSLPSDTDVQKLVFDCSSIVRNYKVVDGEPVYLNTGINPNIGGVAVRFRDANRESLAVFPMRECPETGEMIDNTDDDLDKYGCAEIAGFAKLMFNIKPNKDGVGMYRRLYQIKQEKRKINENLNRSQGR